MPPPSDGPITAAVVGNREVILVTVKERKALIGPSTKEETRTTLTIPGSAEITALALDGRGDDLFVGTAAGEVVRVDVRERDKPRVTPPLKAAAQPGAAVTAMNFLIGDRTLVVGDASGGVSTWQVLQPRQDGDRRLVRMHTFTRHAAPVVGHRAICARQGLPHGGRVRLGPSQLRDDGRDLAHREIRSRRTCGRSPLPPRPTASSWRTARDAPRSGRSRIPTPRSPCGVSLPRSGTRGTTPRNTCGNPPEAPTILNPSSA